jgi:hypothetical protein
VEIGGNRWNMRWRYLNPKPGNAQELIGMLGNDRQAEEKVARVSEENASVREIPGVGEVKEESMVKVFGIQTVGALSALCSKEVQDMQKRIRAEKIPGKLNIERLWKQAKNLVVTG